MNLCSFLRQPSTSDGLMANNQTNLALKGIIGIGAMSRISLYAGKQDDVAKYKVGLVLLDDCN